MVIADGDSFGRWHEVRSGVGNISNKSRIASYSLEIARYAVVRKNVTSLFHLTGATRPISSLIKK